MIKYLLAYALAGACLYAQAQDNIKPLTIGDEVPDITFTNLINYPTKTAKLSDFKGKLVILDFWATWCKSCIAQFPKTQLLQQEYNSQIQFLLIASTKSGDDEQKIKSLLQRLKENNRELKVPIVIDDNLPQLFPHQSLPHYVWINPDGKVAGVTRSQDISKANIQSVLQGSPTHLTQKGEIPVKNLLFLNDSNLQNQIKSYSVFFKGALIDVIGNGGVYSINNGNGKEKKAICLANRPLLEIYRTIASATIPGFDNNSARLFFNNQDSSALYYSDIEPVGRIRWQKDNLYTVGVLSEGGNSKLLYEAILNELNKNSDFYATVKDTTIKHFILSRLNQNAEVKFLRPPNKAEKKQYITTIPHFKVAIRQWLSEITPLIDNTGLKYSETIMVLLPDGGKAGNTSKILAENNLKIEEVVAPLKVLEIKRKNNKTLPYAKKVY